MKRLLLVVLSMVAFGALAAEGGYLFVTFRGEGSAEGEQIYFGLSNDGIRWEALNGDKPALVSTLGEKARAIRICCAAKTADSTYRNGPLHLPQPELVRAVRAGSRAILIWESQNLVDWSQPRLVTVAPTDAGCTGRLKPSMIRPARNTSFIGLRPPSGIISPSTASGEHGPRTLKSSANLSFTSKSRRP